VSRIGKKPIPIPEGVTVTVTDNLVVVKGPRGELRRKIHEEVRAEVKDKEVVIFPVRHLRKTAALWGLSRMLIANMIEGVTAGFEKKLELEGIGYRANLEGEGVLLLQLGFSHPVRFPLPSGIQCRVEKNVITVAGIDKELVGNVAAKIRALKPAEPYKGKGIKYEGEIIRRKAGKKAVAAG